jgi:hypothetical protein
VSTRSTVKNKTFCRPALRHPARSESGSWRRAPSPRFDEDAEWDVLDDAPLGGELLRCAPALTTAGKIQFVGRTSAHRAARVARSMGAAWMSSRQRSRCATADSSHRWAYSRRRVQDARAAAFRTMRETSPMPPANCGRLSRGPLDQQKVEPQRLLPRRPVNRLSAGVVFMTTRTGSLSHAIHQSSAANGSRRTRVSRISGTPPRSQSAAPQSTNPVTPNIYLPNFGLPINPFKSPGTAFPTAAKLFSIATGNDSTALLVVSAC